VVRINQNTDVIVNTRHWYCKNQDWHISLVGQLSQRYITAHAHTTVHQQGLHKRSAIAIVSTDTKIQLTNQCSGISHTRTKCVCIHMNVLVLTATSTKNFCLQWNYNISLPAAE